MKRFDVVIIGGGPGGVTTALSARNAYPEKSIALIRKEETALIPCGIPYVFHTLKTVDDDVLPDKPLNKNQVELIINEVTEIDVLAKRIKFKDGEELEYDKLVLAVGSKPFIPPIPGIDKESVYFIKKDIEYLRKTKECIDKVEKVAIIGGGFIGVEVADELLRKGKKVILIEKLPYLLPISMDKEFGGMVSQLIKEKGSEVITGISVKEIVGGQRAEKIILEDSREFSVDAVIVAAGYRPNLKLAEKIGVKTDPRYGIIVDEYLRTSIKDVFAVGDCTAKRHFLTGEYTKLMLASTAMAQGRLAGSNLFEVKVIKDFPGALGTFSTRICDVAFASVGLTENDARKSGINYIAGINESVDRHPGKLPGASKIFIKLIFARYSHQLLGAQIRGGVSIGEMINMLSAMIQNRMTDMEIDTLQIGTHPLLTSSPIAYPIINATVNAIIKRAEK